MKTIVMLLILAVLPFSVQADGYWDSVFAAQDSIMWHRHQPQLPDSLDPMYWEMRWYAPCDTIGSWNEYPWRPVRIDSAWYRDTMQACDTTAVDTIASHDGFMVMHEITCRDTVVWCKRPLKFERGGE